MVGANSSTIFRRLEVANIMPHYCGLTLAKNKLSKYLYNKVINNLATKKSSFRKLSGKFSHRKFGLKNMKIFFKKEN